MKTIIYSIAFLLISYLAQSQVLIAPTSVHFSDNSNMERIIVFNNSNIDREINITMKFGVPLADSIGSIKVHYENLDNYISKKIKEEDVRIFPNKFILKAGEKQHIRLLMVGEDNYDPEFYWSRLVINSKPVVEELPENLDEIGTQLNFAFNQAIPVTYYRGELKNKIKIKEVLINKENKEMFIRYDKPDYIFFGEAHIEFYDVLDYNVWSETIPLSIYDKGSKTLYLDDVDITNFDNVKIFLVNGRGDDKPVNFPVIENNSYKLIIKESGLSSAIR